MQTLIPREEIDEFKQLFSEALKIDPESQSSRFTTMVDRLLIR